MKLAESLVIKAFRQPKIVKDFDLSDWNTFLRQARQSKTLSRIAYLIKGSPWTAELPCKALDHLSAARAEADKHQRMICWEARNIAKTLATVDTPVILLKGAAYVIAGLPSGWGRKVNDIDIMVLKSKIDEVENTLLGNGWEPMKHDAYDQKYFRTWMHELPPLKHAIRKTVIDVHHTILPESGRLHPDPEKLFAAARPIKGSNFYMLSPEDMVLHSAANLFQQGDLIGGLRDLKDIDDLLRYFSETEAGFWQRLVPRARMLDLARPLFYALHFSILFFQTAIPIEVQNASRDDGPARFLLIIMDFLVFKTLIPQVESGASLVSKTASMLLYIRSHWLRMPPYLLAKHLGYKAFLSVFSKEKERNQI
jgi:hypothetical protein